MAALFEVSSATPSSPVRKARKRKRKLTAAQKNKRRRESLKRKQRESAEAAQLHLFDSPRSPSVDSCRNREAVPRRRKGQAKQSQQQLPFELEERPAWELLPFDALSLMAADDETIDNLPEEQQAAITKMIWSRARLVRERAGRVDDESY